MPESEERARRELELQVILGDALRSAKRYGHELECAYSRARELCEQLGDISRVIQVLYGQYVITFNRPSVPAAAEIVRELLHVAQEHESAVASILAQHACGGVCFAAGDMMAARTHLERALASSSRAQERGALAQAQYPALSLSYLSWTLFVLGYADQAETRCNEALAEAEQASHLTLALTLDNALCFDQFRRDERAVRERAGALSSLATEIGRPFYAEIAKFSLGWTLARRDQISQGIALMRDSMDAVWAAGMRVQAPYQLAQLAEAYERMKETRAALRCIGEAFARAEETGERWYDAELSRLKGDLLAAKSPAWAETCFRRALEIARGQDARMWELRAATSLARLWRDQGKRAEACDLLAPVYGWFTEGFDTADLKDAKALLDELG